MEENYDEKIFTNKTRSKLKCALNMHLIYTEKYFKNVAVLLTKSVPNDSFSSIICFNYDAKFVPCVMKICPK